MSVYKVDRSSFLYRSVEIGIPLLVWATITMPIWLSFFHPAVASYLILAYLLYFLYKTAKTAYYGTVSYRIMKAAEKIDWQKKLKESPDSSHLHHYVLIVNYKESEAKLTATINKVVEQNYDKKKINVMIGMEEREGEDAKKRAAAIKNKFKGKLHSVEAVYHKLEVGEVVGKASNAAYASQVISQHIRKRNIKPEHAIITVCDADSLLPPDYLAYVTFKFINDKDSQYHFYAAPVLLYNNFWKLPMLIRIQTILSSVSRFAYISSLREDLIQISTYSTNLWLLEQVGYWDTDIIPEDWHIWMQAFFTLGEKVRTIPIYVPIVRDGVLSTSWIKTFKTRYEQERRWAWGVSDIPYAVVRFFDSPHINFWIKLKRLFRVSEVHFLWPTSFFILTIAASIPPLVNPTFQRTVMGLLLPKLSSFILTISSLILIAVIYFDYQLRKRLNIKTQARNMPLLFVQFYLLPIISFLFSSLPALEAHTRMLLGKSLEYKVTEKV